MIDLQKIKIGERVFCLVYETIYEPDDDFYEIKIPIGIKSFVLEKKERYPVFDLVLSKCGERYCVGDVYYTKEEALDGLNKKLKEGWEYFKCDEMIKKLLKVQEVVKRTK